MARPPEHNSLHSQYSYIESSSVIMSALIFALSKTAHCWGKTENEGDLDVSHNGQKTLEKGKLKKKKKHWVLPQEGEGAHEGTVKLVIPKVRLGNT